MTTLAPALSLIAFMAFALVAVRFWRERRGAEASLAALLAGVAGTQLVQGIAYPPNIDLARLAGDVLRVTLAVAGVLILARRPG